MTKMDFSDFGYIVSSCPLNKTEYTTSATRLGCGVDENGRSQYVCVPNNERSSLVEFCYQSTVGFYEKGNCIEVHESGNLDQTSSMNFTYGCPSQHFFLSDIYKFPACHRINPKERCFNADPACPNITESHSIDRNPQNGTLSTGAVAGIVIGIIGILLMVVVIIVLNFLRLRRPTVKGTSKRPEKYFADEEEDEPHMPLLDRDPRELVVLNVDPKYRKRKIHKSEDEKKKNKAKEAKEKEMLSNLLGDYNDWKTEIHEKFERMSDDELCVLACFMLSDTGAPDFTDENWMKVLNTIRDKMNEGENPLTNVEVQNILESLKCIEFLDADQDGLHIIEDAADEILYVFVQYSFLRSDFNNYYPSFETTKKYVRSQGYERKPGEKCAICISPKVESIMIFRVQMDILTSVTMEDKAIHHKIFQILNIPESISRQGMDERKQFLLEHQEAGELVHTCSRGESQKIAQVTWNYRFWRSEFARSCIGRYPHTDIYIINNKAYRKLGGYHSFPDNVRCVLYCLLFMKNYTKKDKDYNFQKLLEKIRKKYFPQLAHSIDFTSSNVPMDVTNTEAGLTTFASEDIRHKVMYTFVTACLMEDNDLEFFLSEASSDVILEYCRSWEYERSENERCLYIPYRPEKMINALIDKLQMNIISHCTISDENVHDSICERLEVPREVLFWEQEARERYVEYAKRGTQTVHHARGMIVGCAGAGKTTLLKRLLRCSEEEIMNVKSTEVLDVHEEIIDENQSLKATSRTTKYSFEERPSKTLTFFDFGGQCVYYACHQIYLTGRAFYIVVVDASKDLNEKTDGNVCDQNGSLFSEWTYGDYFEFWIKSIHTFCGREKKMINRPIVLIVATHWEKTNYKSEEEFVERLQQNFPKNSNLLQYVDKDSCFFTQFPITPLEALEKRIVEIASQKRWREEIPKGWAFFEIEINQRKAERKMLDLSDIVSKNTEDNKENNERKDMLRYYHDAGKVLYFNEDGLEKWIIIDVQWFVNVFKGIITDKLHLKGIEATWLDWDDYYNTGCLRKEVLMEIFKRKENKNATANFTVRENQASHKSDITVYYVRDETQSSGKKNIDQSSPYLLNNLDIILNFMQRLGLIAKGENYHYIPCMNRKTFDKSILNMIGETHEKTSILLFHFKYLPYFLYFRLVVACLNLEGWIALKNKSTSCLYKNAAFFSYNENIIAIAVTETSIQLQVYIPNDESHTSVEITRDIQGSVEKILKKIATTFHRRVEFERGFSCMNENEQYITIDMEEHFIPGKSVKIGSKVSCPLHRFEGRHFINTSELMRFWDFDAM